MQNWHLLVLVTLDLNKHKVIQNKHKVILLNDDV